VASITLQKTLIFYFVFIIIFAVEYFARSDNHSNNTNTSKKENKKHLRRVVYWQRHLELLRLKGKEGSILDAITTMDRRSILIRKTLVKLEKKARLLEHSANVALKDWKYHQEVAKKILLEIQPRLFILYRFARLGQGRLLLGARSLRNFATRWRALKLLSGRDIKKLKAYHRIKRLAYQKVLRWKKKQKELEREKQLTPR